MHIQAGQTALVTGASSGLGATFAEQLAARGLNLVLVARREDRLRALATRLGREHGVRTEVLAADLSTPDAAAGLLLRTTSLGLTPDLLINNAGFATHGRFDALPLAAERAEVLVNVLAVVELCHAFLPALLARRGGILNVASRGGFQPAGNMAVYAASKAFVISFSEALWAENRARGVQVSVLCPGAVATEFFDELGAGAAVGRAASPDFVVRAALHGFERGRMTIIPGWDTYLVAQLPRLLPRALIARVTERLTRTPSASAPKVPSAAAHTRS